MQDFTVSKILKNGYERIASVHTCAQLESEILLSYVLNKPRAWLKTWPEKELNISAVETFNNLVEHRCKGMPIAYLIGQKEFWSLNLDVTTDTLIPRPETELLVELALQYIPQKADYRIIDLGTGSGAIAIALATERRHCQILATDISDKALQVARRNIIKHKLANVTLIESCWFEKIGEQIFDIIVANPPYLSLDDPHRHQGDLRFEPVTALVAGTTGMEALEIIATESLVHLRPGGWLFIEHGYNQENSSKELLKKLGYINLESHQDLARKARLICGQRFMS